MHNLENRRHTGFDLIARLNGLENNALCGLVSANTLTIYKQAEYHLSITCEQPLT